MEAVQAMNGEVWIFAILIVGMVVVQSLLFLRLALRFNAKNKVLSKTEVNQATRTGIIAAIGPAFSTMTIAISMIVMIGSGATFMRCGVIGAPAFELYIASVCASTVGVEFGTAEFTTSIFTLCIFGMTLASAPYFINTIITLKPLDKMAEKGTQKKESRSFLPYMANAAMIGILGYMILEYCSTTAAFLALAVGGLVCYLIMVLG